MKMKMRDPLRRGIIPLSLMMEMSNLLCGQHQGKKLRRKGATQPLMTETLHRLFLQDRLQVHQCEEEEDRQYGKTQLSHWNKVSRDSRERAEDASILGRKAESEALRNIVHKLSDERNLRDLHLKHYHMSTAQFKKRTTHSDIPGNVCDLDQHVVKTCPFWNSIKTETRKISRDRTPGRRIWRPHLFWTMDRQKIGDKTFGFLIVVGAATSHLTAYPCKSTTPSEVVT